MNRGNGLGVIWYVNLLYLLVLCLFSSRWDIKEGHEALGTTVYHSWPKRGQVLVLAGMSYHTVDTANIPPAFAEVLVALDDNGVTLPVRFLGPTATHTNPLL